MRRRDFLRSSLGALAGATVAARAQAMTAGHEQSRRILYVYGQFVDASPEQMIAAVETLGASGFNVLILSFLQATPAAGKLQLSYDGSAFRSLSPQVPALMRRLRSGFGVRKRLMLSIGGWGNLATFEAIRSFGIPAFVRQLTEEAILPLGLDGIDLDLEPQTGGLENWFAVQREYGKAIVELTNEYKRVHRTHLVTHAPISTVAAKFYARPAAMDGLSGGLLRATRTVRGNNIDWLNVQLYEGGALEGGDIAGFYRDSLVKPLMEIAATGGIRQALPFLVPLFEPGAKQPLTFCRRTIAAINARCADLHQGRVEGAALWDYKQVARSIQGWSEGLEAAFNQ